MLNGFRAKAMRKIPGIEFPVGREWLSCRGHKGDEQEGPKILAPGRPDIDATLVASWQRDNDVWGLARFSRPEQRAELEPSGSPASRRTLAVDTSMTFDDFDYVLPRRGHGGHGLREGHGTHLRGKCRDRSVIGHCK